MMKRNAIARTLIASAVLAVVGLAQAGSLTVTKRTVANESFGTAATNTVFVPNVAYVFNTPGGIVVNPSGAVQVKYVLAGGTWTTAGGALASGNAVVSNLPVGLTAGTPSINTAGDTVTVVLTNTSTTSNAQIGIGATVTLTSVSAAARFQAASIVQGTVVTVSGGAYNGVNVLEAPTAASTVVDYAQAVTLSFVASTETKKIDLTATPAGSGLTTGVAGANLVQLGKVKATNATTAPNDLDVSSTLVENPITVNSSAFLAGAGAYTVTVGLSTGTYTAKQGIALYNAAACTGAIAATASTQTPLATAVTAATTTATLSQTATNAQASTDLVTNGVFVCSDYSGVTAGSTLSQMTPSITASLVKASTAYTGDSLAASTGYALNNNGQTRDVRSYIPAATVGYTSFVRVINTGTIAAAVTGIFLNEDGTTSGSGVIGTLAAGGTKTFASSAIETSVGFAPAATARPRLRLTAPTSGLEAQSFFLTNANGNFSDSTGAQ